jgi:DNA-binding MarR family transcriptional regulator
MTKRQGLDKTEVAARLALAVGRLNRRIRPTADGLTHGQVSALSTIARQGPLRPGDLARIERVAAPTITRILAELETKGFVSRAADPDDGRSFFVEASAAGEAEVLRAREERAVRVLELFDGLSEEQIAELAAALDALEATAGLGLPVASAAAKS